MNDYSIVGDIINFRGLVYSPVNEQGVVLLFGRLYEDLNIIVEDIRAGFPDCIARQYLGKGWKQIRIEFEFKSSNFSAHGHDPDKCDIIVCWEHDWDDYPKAKLEIICLKDEVEKFEKLDREKARSEIEEESDVLLKDEDRKIREMFTRWNTPISNRELFYEIDPMIRNIDPSNIWLKTDVVWSFNYYCYKNIFVWIEPQVRALSVNYFVGDEWEGMKIIDSEGIKKVLLFIKKSYELIKLKYSKN